MTGPAGNQIDASCNSSVTISCLKQLYNSVAYNTSATNGNKLGLTGYLGQYANNMDLQQFYQLENPSAYGSNYTFVSINGILHSKLGSYVADLFHRWIEQSDFMMQQQALKLTSTRSLTLDSHGPRLLDRSTRLAASLLLTLIC